MSTTVQVQLPVSSLASSQVPAEGAAGVLSWTDQMQSLESKVAVSQPLVAGGLPALLQVPESCTSQEQDAVSNTAIWFEPTDGAPMALATHWHWFEFQVSYTYPMEPVAWHAGVLTAVVSHASVAQFHELENPLWHNCVEGPMLPTLHEQVDEFQL